MAEVIDQTFKNYRKVFLRREEELKAFLLRYCEGIFDRYELEDVERIDSTERIVLAGFHEPISGWRNIRHIVLFSCEIEQGTRKRYDYKFNFKQDIIERTERVFSPKKEPEKDEITDEKEVSDEYKPDIDDLEDDEAEIESEGEKELTEEEKEELRKELEQKLEEVKTSLEEENFSLAKKDSYEIITQAKAAGLDDVMNEAKDVRKEVEIKEKEDTEETFQGFIGTQTLKDIVEMVDDSQVLKNVKNEALELEEKIASEEDPEKKELLQNLKHVHEYSIRNYLMVLAQARKRQDNNFVGVINSYWNWKRQGAQVLKNPDKSKPYSYKIFMPVFKKKKTEGDYLSGFKIGNVFDISQTNKFEVYKEVREHAKEALEYKDEVDHETAVSFIEKNYPDLTIEVDHDMEQENGIYDSEANKITLKNESSHDLFHQIGYFVVSELELKRTDEDANLQNEILAEITAYLLMKKLEIEGKYKINYDFGYSHCWALNILDEFKFREFEKLYKDIQEYVSELEL